MRRKDTGRKRVEHRYCRSKLKEWMVGEIKKERGTQSAESLIELFLRIVISINYSVDC